MRSDLGSGVPTATQLDQDRRGLESASTSISGSSRERLRTLVLLLAFSGCTCTRIAGPAAQLSEAARRFENLKRLPETGLAIQKLQISRVTPEPELSVPRVVFSFDLDGSLDGVAVSALGVEKVQMRYADERWQPIGSPLPRLEQTLARLRKREAGVRRWLLRIDVSRIDVTEERADGTRRVLAVKALPDGGVQLAD